MKNKGVLSSPDEPHNSVQVPGRFMLDSVDVDLLTIIVWLKSPT